MEQTFNSILQSILKDIEGNQGKDIDAVITEKMAEMNVSQEGQELLKETNDLLEAFEVKKQSLAEAKREGKTREVWMQERLYEKVSDERLSEQQQDELVHAITENCNEVLKETLEKGE